MAATARARRILPVGPLLLIALGLGLLLTNLGLLPWEIWRTAVRLWPLVLVLLGLQALVTGRVDWAALLALLVAFALLSLGTRFLFPIPRGSGATVAPAAEVLRQGLEGAQQASIRVQFGGGELSIGSLDQPGLLARGELAGERSGRLLSEYRVRGGVGMLEVRPDDPRPGRSFFFNRGDGPPDRLRLDLARGVPIDLEVQAGAADSRLDLRDLTIPSLRLSAGAARSTVTLPASGATRADVQAGAASVSIEVPPGVAASIRTAGSGLSRLSVDESRFPRTGQGYESPDYASATNRAELTLRAGAASVDVR